MRPRLVFLLTCTVLACSGGDQTDAAAPIDAGVDGPSDVGIDATLDATHDVGVDGPAEAGADADAGPDPGWERLPGFPDDCYVERALHPENVLAFHWEPCLDDLPACQMAVLDSSVAPLDRIFVVNGGNDLRGLIGWALRAETASIMAMTRDDAVAIAWRAGPYANHAVCLANVAASRMGVGVEAFSVTGDGHNFGYVASVDWSHAAVLGDDAWTEVSPLFPPGDSLGTPSTSDTTFAGVLLSGDILAVEPPSAAIVGHGGLGPVVVGHSVLWNWGDATGATGIHISRIGGSEIELYRASPTTSVLGARADGTWIAWRSYTATSTTDTLWAAPYRETAPLDARPLWSDLTPGTSGTIGDGMLAHADGDATMGTPPVIHVVSLVDGSRRTYPVPDTLPDGSRWRIRSDPSWVTRDEVAFPAGRIAASGERLQTVLRIDLRGLPVEVLPAGGEDAGM